MVKATRSYLQRQLETNILRFTTLLSLVSCVIGVAVVLCGLSEVQKFVTNQAHDLARDPFNHAAGFSRLSTYPPVEQITIYVDGVKFQVWIAAGLLLRLCALLMRTKMGIILAELSLLLATALLWRYGVWSFQLLHFDSYLRKDFLVAVPQGLSWVYIIAILLMLIWEILVLATFFTRNSPVETRSDEA